jgi:hypothetical protein
VVEGKQLENFDITSECGANNRVDDGLTFHSDS